MPRYAFIVKALSTRDGGWVRLPRLPAVLMVGNQYFPTEEDGWRYCCILFPLMVTHGDFKTVTVERTIVFHSERFEF